MKPKFERLRKVLMLEGEPDRIPLIELWVDCEIKEKLLGKPIGDLLLQAKDYRVEADIEFWSKTGYDYIHVVPQYTLSQKKKAKGREWAPEKRGMITSEEEFEAFPWPEEIDYSRLEKGKHHLPAGMRIISGSLAGIYEETWMLMGFEQFALGLIKRPEFVKRLMDKVGKLTLQIFEEVSSYDQVGALWLSDDIAYIQGTMVAPKFLRQYLFPWYRKIVLVGKKHNLPVLYHSDGNLWPVMEDLIEVGFNAIHPIEPKAMNIRELKEKIGDKFCLLGGIGLDYPLSRGKPSEVEEAVKAMLKAIAPGGGYAIGSSNSITEWVPLENYKALLRASLRWGRYPIQ
jgi:uroporphyrinogen decarboxylase